MKLRLFFILFLIFCLPVKNVQAQNYFQQTAKISEKTVQPKNNVTLGKMRMKFMQFQRKINKEINLKMNLSKSGNLWALFALVGLGFSYGVVHSLGPGHGKLLIISYFSGKKSNWAKGVLMGCQVAVTHVLSSVILVLTVKGVAEYLLYGNEQAQIKIIQIISYTAIIFAGLYMLYSKIKHTDKEHHHEDKCSSGLFALCVGLNPCTGSLLVLLYAMAHQQLWLGLYVVAAISTGIAVTLSAIGVLSIFMQTTFLEKSQSKKTALFAQILGYIGAILIIILGAFLLHNTLY